MSHVFIKAAASAHGKLSLLHRKTIAFPESPHSYFNMILINLTGPEKHCIQDYASKNPNEGQVQKRDSKSAAGWADAGFLILCLSPCSPTHLSH